jgi:hypothetical protein
VYGIKHSIGVQGPEGGGRIAAFPLPPIIESATICLPRPRYRRLGQMPEPHHSELNDPTALNRLCPKCGHSIATAGIRLWTSTICGAPAVATFLPKKQRRCRTQWVCSAAQE